MNYRFLLERNKKTDLLYNEYINNFFEAELDLRFQIYDWLDMDTQTYDALFLSIAPKCWWIIKGASQVSPTDEVQLQDINTFALISSYFDIMHYFLFLQYLMIM